MKKKTLQEVKTQISELEEEKENISYLNKKQLYSRRSSYLLRH